MKNDEVTGATRASKPPYPRAVRGLGFHENVLKVSRLGNVQHDYSVYLKFCQLRTEVFRILKINGSSILDFKLEDGTTQRAMLAFTHRFVILFPLYLELGQKA